MATRQDIYEFVAQRGRPGLLPGGWRALCAESPFFQPEADSAALLAALQEAFPPDDLLDAFIVQENAEGSVALHPALLDSNAAILALRKSAKSQPFALLTAGECLDRTELPLNACLRDFRTVAGLNHNEGHLLISFSPSDFQVLWSLGFPVAPATDLGRVNRTQVDTFCAALRLRRRPSDSAASGELAASANPADTSSIRLTLVGWSLAQVDCSVPSDLEMVQRHLTALHDMLRLPVDAFTLWQPPAAEIERLRFCLDTGDRVDVQNAVGRSLRNHFRPFVAVPVSTAPVSSVPGYAAVRREWLSQAGPDSDRFRRQKIWEQLEQLQAKQLIEPLLAEAQRASDPLVRNQLVALANAGDLLHKQSLLIVDRCSKGMRQTNSTSGSMVPREEFDQWQTLLKQFSALIQSLQTVKNGGQRRPRAQ